MSVMLGILLNTLIIAGMIVWLSRGGGAAWVNTLNATSLSTCISLFIIMETSGAVLGMFIWAMVNGKQDAFTDTLGYLGIWFAFLGTHVLADRATNIGKRLTDGTYAEKKGSAAAKVEEAKKAPVTIVQPVTGEHVAPPPPAPAPIQQTTVNVGEDAGKAEPIPAKPAEEPEWAQGEPRAGIL